jgi:hypothetical protein
MHTVLAGKSEGKRSLEEDLGVDVRITEAWIFDRYDACGLDSSGSGQGPMAGFCEQSNEPSDSIKCWEFLD